jgi:hypothetical protein
LLTAVDQHHAVALADVTVDLDGVIATSAASHSVRGPFGPPKRPPSLGPGRSRTGRWIWFEVSH